MHHVVGGGHVLAELLLQAEEAQGGGGIRVALGEPTADSAGGGDGRRAEWGVCRGAERHRKPVIFTCPNMFSPHQEDSNGFLANVTGL